MLFGSGWFTRHDEACTQFATANKSDLEAAGVWTWQQSATLRRFRASHHRHDLGIPSSGCFVDGNKVLPSCSVEFTSMAVGGGAIATPHLASFSRASLRFVPSVRKGRM